MDPQSTSSSSSSPPACTTTNTNRNPRSLFPHRVRCHCGKVQGRFRTPQQNVTVVRCNCSDCTMRQNDHLIVPSRQFDIVPSDQHWKAATTLYLWGTQTAVRRFCATCGVLPWYTPRSNPDGVAITVHCVEWNYYYYHTHQHHDDYNDDDSKHQNNNHHQTAVDTTPSPPTLVWQDFDGAHWEENIAKSNLASMSK